MVIIGQKTLREELGIDVMAQLKASVLKEQGRHDGAGMELTVRSVGEPNDGAVLRAAMAVTAFVPGVAPGDVERDVDNEVTLTLLPSQRPMLFQGSQVEMRDRVGVLETTVDDSVDHDSPPGCAKMLRDIVFRTHLDVLRRVLPGDPPARKKPVAVRLHSGAKVVRANPPPGRNRLPWSAGESCPDCRSVVMTSLSSRWPWEGRRGRRAPGSRCHGGSMTSAVLPRGLKSLPLKTYQMRGSYCGMVHVCDQTLVCRGVSDSDLLIF